MIKKNSFLITPINIAFDLIVINSILYFIGNENYVNWDFMPYINAVWLLISYYTNYYKISRTTKELKILNLIFGQFLIFILCFFAFFSIFKEGYVVHKQFLTLSLILVSLFVVKFGGFYSLKFYRGIGRNFRRVVIIGHDSTTKKLAKILSTQEHLGFRNLGFFSDEIYKSENYLGPISKSHQFVLENDVDDIYCSILSVDKEIIKDMIWFAKSNRREIKLIPNEKEIYTKNLSIEYYDTLPVLKVKKLPFEKGEIRFFKRTYDIIFSSLVIILLLSWLIPLMWLIIKIDSKGPLMFRQKRIGINDKEFYCYKFRSMKRNNESDTKSASKDDQRITRIGNFIRRTSIDELPQFINVLKGDMSVVGPRPHMKKQSLGFQNDIENYFKRNAVKPGITGLAQVSGYRGEIKKKSDIENRIRLDIFYIEKWSFLLDIKIILMTIINVIKGEEKAY